MDRAAEVRRLTSRSFPCSEFSLASDMCQAALATQVARMVTRGFYPSFMRQASSQWMSQSLMRGASSSWSSAPVWMTLLHIGPSSLMSRFFRSFQAAWPAGVLSFQPSIILSRSILQPCLHPVLPDPAILHFSSERLDLGTSANVRSQGLQVQ